METIAIGKLIYEKGKQLLIHAGIEEDNFSTAEQIVEIVYQATTDDRDKLRYVACTDAETLYAQCLQLNDEAFGKK